MIRSWSLALAFAFAYLFLTDVTRTDVVPMAAVDAFLVGFFLGLTFLYVQKVEP